jgi:ABC-type sugar transport system ATPase subunit
MPLLNALLARSVPHNDVVQARDRFANTPCPATGHENCITLSFAVATGCVFAAAFARGLEAGGATMAKRPEAAKRPIAEVDAPGLPTAAQADGRRVPVVAVENISRSYPGVRALRDVSLDLRAGEVHALVGENGAGKSTLIRILSGDTPPDEGTIRIGGNSVAFASPSDARRHGIVAIFQELMIVPELSVAENVLLGNEPGPVGFLYSRREAERRTAEVLRSLGAGRDIDPRGRADNLSTAKKQIVEIARALVLEAPVIIMDEPTAALSANEASALIAIVRQLRAEGTSILFVSHRLDEVREIADRVTVLRGGEVIATLDAAAIADTGALIELMVGRPIEELFPPRNDRIGDVALNVQNLTRAGAFADVSFDVRAGEVLGVAGLVGAGRTEVMRAIFGADRADSGTIARRGRNLAIRNPRDAIAAGIAYLPEDRKEHGLVLSLSGSENVVMASLERHGRLGLVSWQGMRRAARSIADRLQFIGRLEAPARMASGGNQQKLVIGKWVLTGAEVLIFDEPTRGIDIGAKAEVYRLMHQLAGQGAAIVLVSSELPELMNVCHRIVVMSGGRIQDELAQDEFTERRILDGAFAAHMAEAGPMSSRGLH